jgi:hypothetical protein
MAGQATFKLLFTDTTMIRIAHIQSGEIVNVSLASDDWEAPVGGSQMTEAAALAAGIPRASSVALAARPDLESWRVKVWLSRNGINPESVPAIIDGMFPDGPERWEAKTRWATAPLIPFNHPLVPQLAFELGIEPGAVWDQIAATE